MEHEGDNDSSCNCCPRKNHQRIREESWRFENKVIKISYSTSLLRSTWILRWVLETCCHLNSSERLSAGTGVKNPHGVKYYYYYYYYYKNNNNMKINMKTWRVKLTAGGRNLAEIKTQRSIFHRNALSPLLFIIAMMPLNHIHKKCTAG